MIEWERGGGASVGSISLDALGDPELTEAIRAGDADGTEALVQRLLELDGYYVELRREASGHFGVEQLGSLVGRMLASIPAGTAAGPSDDVADFRGDEPWIDAAVAEILGSTMLAEYSDADARTAAATVAAATAALVGAVTVVMLSAAHLGALLSLLLELAVSS
jgi:hypothetical protein